MSVILITFAGAPKVSEKAISKVCMILSILICIQLPEIQSSLPTEFVFVVKLKVFIAL